MSPAARARWFSIARKWQKRGIIKFALVKKSARFIDAYGMKRALAEGVSQALSKLSLSPKATRVLLDGSLRAPETYPHQKTVIGGDDKHKEISLASVIAKVSRDRLMEQLAKRHSAYGWGKNKGYGTKEHYRAIKRHGITTLHRKSFLKNLA